jgi:hypothetical protein
MRLLRRLDERGRDWFASRDVLASSDASSLAGDLGDEMERFLRRSHADGADDLHLRAQLECELRSGLTIDELAGQQTARYAFGTGGGRYRRPRLVPHA